MSSIPRRVIARLDIKGPNLVKGIHLEGLRVMGDPGEHATRYYEGGADELIYIDIVASLYERNNLTEVVEKTAAHLFVPLTVGGGIRKIDDITQLLRVGADKVAINTAAIRNPDLIREASRTFGSQCIVVSIEAKRRPGNNGWEAYTDNGREKTGLDVIEWSKRAVELGAGELLITSVDKEGTKKGFDLELVEKLAALPIPVIACGGAGSIDHVYQAIEKGADAVAVASLLHYKMETVSSLKTGLRNRGIDVRV